MNHRALGVLALLLAASCVETPYEDENLFPHPPYGATTHQRAVIEGKYRDLLYNLENRTNIEGHPEAGRVEQLVRALKDYEADAQYSFQEIIVGVPPDERAVGYLESFVYPRVLLFNRDTGRHEPTRFEFHYVRDLELSPMPRGLILGDGQTLLPGREADEDVLLGRFSLETAAALLLHVCPCCGASVPRTIFLSLTRPDIDPAGVAEFKTAMVKEHGRINRDYLPVQGLPAEFWNHPLGHKCYAAFKEAKDYGFEPMIPVRFRPVKSSELSAPVAGSATDAAGEGKADDGEASPAEE